MDTKDLLDDRDLLNNTHTPVLELFNAWGCCGFDILLDSLSQGIGAGSPLTGCFFLPSSSADSAQTSSNVGDVYFESEYMTDIKVSLADFYYYMVLASQRYLTSHPTDKSKIEKYLKTFHDRFLVNSI